MSRNTTLELFPRAQYNENEKEPVPSYAYDQLVRMAGRPKIKWCTNPKMCRNINCEGEINPETQELMYKHDLWSGKLPYPLLIGPDNENCVGEKLCLLSLINKISWDSQHVIGFVECPAMIYPLSVVC